MSNSHPAWCLWGGFKCVKPLLSLTGEEGLGTVLFPALPFLTHRQGMSLIVTYPPSLSVSLHSFLSAVTRAKEGKSGRLWGQQLQEADWHLSGAWLLFNGIDMGPLLLTPLGASSSHLPSLSLGCFGPCGKSGWSHSTSPPCCIRAVCLGAASMLQIGTSWCFCWSWGLSLKPFWRQCPSTAWAVLLLASTSFTVNWNVNGITWN